MSNTSCTEFIRSIERSVEGRLPLDTAEFRAHAALCTACRAAWLDALLLDGAVVEWRKRGRKMLPAVDLTDLVLFRRTAAAEAMLSVANTPFAAPGPPSDDSAAVGPVHPVSVPGAPAAANRTRKPRARLGLRAAAVSAIVLAATVCVAVFSTRSVPRQGDFETAHIVPAPPIQSSGPTQTPPKIAVAERNRSARDEQPSPKPAAEAPVETMVADAESAYLGLANEAAQAVTGASALVPRPGSVAATAEASGDNDRWVDDVGRQFEPVGSNLTQAFQFLLEAVPAEKAPAT